MYKFAFKNLWLKKTRSLLALIGLSIAIVGVIGLISISGGIRATVTDVLGKMEGVTVMQKDVIDDIFSSISLDDADDIRSFPEVKVVAPTVSGMASNIEGKGKELQASPFGGMIIYMGVDPSENLKLKRGSLYNPDVTKGRFLKPGDKYNAVIGQTVATDYKKSVGTSIEFNTEKFRIVGIFETGSQFTDNMIFIPISVAQDLAGKESDFVSTFYVELKNPADSEKLATKINFRFDNLEAKTGSGYSEDIGSMISNLDMFFLVISSVAIIVGAIGIINTMLMSVMERTREFGILKAVGWTSDDILKLIIFESFFLGIIGGLAGCTLGWVATQGLSIVLPFKLYASPTLILSAFALAMILGVVGGIYPAWRASKLDPVEAIRYE